MFNPIKLEYVPSRGWKTNEKTREWKVITWEIKNPILAASDLRSIKSSTNIFGDHKDESTADKLSNFKDIKQLCQVVKQNSVKNKQKRRYQKFWKEYEKPQKLTQAESFQAYGSSKSLENETKTTSSTISRTPDKMLMSRKFLLKHK